MWRLFIGKEQSSLASSVAEVEGPTVFDVLRVDLRSKALDSDELPAGREVGSDWLSLSVPGGSSHGWLRACVKVIRVAGFFARSLSMKSIAIYSEVSGPDVSKVAQDTDLSR